jgi:pimeloyl-ACP methyl ester carboxylesterase
VHSVLYSAADSRRLPFLLHQAYRDNWGPFVARRNASSDFSTEGGMGLLLHLAVTCAEDYPRLTPALRADDGRGSFMAGVKEERMLALCEQMKVPAVPLAVPSRIDAPVLMFSGALDPVTPPRRAEAAAAHFAHAQHFIVDNAGHGVSQLGCAPRLLREFLDNPAGKLNASCLTEIPAPSFQLGSAGPQP